MVAVVALSTVSVLGGKVSSVFSGTGNAMDSNLAGLVSAGEPAPSGPSNSAPVWTSSGQVGTVRPGVSSGTSIATLSATDADGNALTFSATGLPSWTSLSSSGLLTVAVGQTPPQTSSSQSFSFSATVSDGTASPVSSSFSIGLVISW